ncbi:guanylate-binding protein 1-like [Oppia nitens]|uniref:guanylate-binding protein 1-like n=1 Tax=Oppia nitens TaxID=1686743 RepID=UPI0023DAEAEA|nr:guanylate-binding protein 1-like [Oppia nitens]
MKFLTIIGVIRLLAIFVAVLAVKVTAKDINENLVTADSVRTATFESEFPEKPLQLVRPDVDHKRLVIVEENVKLLHRLVGPVATVAVVGKFHSGKSFLMNQLMGKSNGFGVGPDVRPKTMGIWMWGKPTKYTLDSGLKTWIVFLDTEGFAANNVSENYDAKIFAVSTLLSSFLLYNSVKIIDQSDIDYLELLARRTQLFALRSQMSRKKWTNEFNKDLLSFPPLIWIVQDFVQSTLEESPKQWLHRLMGSHTRENDLYEISLKDIFKSVDCHTLFLPAVKKHLLNDLSLAKESDLTEEYIFEKKELINKLKRGIVPKEKNTNPITGIELAALLEILVNAANDGSLADIPNRWDAFVARLQETAIEDCLKFYEADMNVLIIDEYDNNAINILKFDEWHIQSQERSIQLLKQLLHGLEDPLTKGLHDLSHKITIHFERTRDINEKKIKLKCSQSLHELEIKSEQRIRAIQLPVQTSHLITQAKEILKDIKSDYINQVKDLVDSSTMELYLETLTKAVKNQVSSIQLENNRAIEEFFDRQIQESIGKFDSVSQSDYSRVKPRKPTLLRRIFEESNIQALDMFNNNCQQYTSESIYESKLALLKIKLNEKILSLEKQNELIAKTYIQNESNRLVDEFRSQTGTSFIPLPVNNTELESRIKLEVSKSIRDYSDLLTEYSTYQTYDDMFVKFKENLVEICDQRRNENVKAFTKEVETPLKTSKKIISLSHHKYTTVFSFKQFMHSVCLLHLDEGKPKYWSLKLKSEIIDEFISSDKQLLELIESKSGLYSSIIGFFQWILWILNLG